MRPPARGGTYILAVELSSPIPVKVGKLGSLAFDAGVFAYVGSAHGPGGLAARLGRYWAGPLRQHWHIDYLVREARVIATLFRADDKRRECVWSGWLQQRARHNVPGFGSSDCRCASHLFFIGGDTELEQMIRDAGCELKAISRMEGDDGL